MFDVLFCLFYENMEKYGNIVAIVNSREEEDLVGLG